MLSIKLTLLCEKITISPFNLKPDKKGVMIIPLFRRVHDKPVLDTKPLQILWEKESVISNYK